MALYLEAKYILPIKYIIAHVFSFLKILFKSVICHGLQFLHGTYPMSVTSSLVTVTSNLFFSLILLTLALREDV